MNLAIGDWVQSKRYPELWFKVERIEIECNETVIFMRHYIGNDTWDSSCRKLYLDQFLNWGKRLDPKPNIKFTNESRVI